MAITALASLNVGLLGMTNTALKNEVMLGFDNKARYLAESGLNYAVAFAAEILNGSTQNVMTDLDGRVINSGLAANQQISLSVSVSASNPYDYIVSSTGTVNQGLPWQANYTVTNVINAPPAGSGIFIVESKPGTAIASPTGVTVNASSLTDFTAGISFDPRFAGADNQISSANFQNGIGGLGQGVRIYFEYSISAGSNADGFVFAIKNGTYNTVHDGGGPLAGVSHGSFLGYAGPGYPFWGNGLGIRPPKLGVEFDIYTNSGHSSVASDGRNDPDNHHLANVFWGTTWNTTASPPTNIYPTTSYYAYDDNVHGIGGANTKTDPSPYNPTTSSTDPGGSGLPGMISINRTLMVGTASPVPVRIEIIRPTTVYSTSTTNSHYNMYAYVIKTWHNCTSPSCSDIGQDYTGSTPTMQYTVFLTATTHAAMGSFIYAYQISTGAATGNYTFSIPKIGMR